MKVAPIFENILRWVYPHTCAGCGYEIFNPEARICWLCQEQLPRTGFEAYQENPVKKIFAGRLPVVNASAWLYFSRNTITQHLVHAVKYKGDQALGIQLGQMLARDLQASSWWNTVDVIVPMPLNAKKLQQRGFNQAALVAEGMGTILQKPVKPVAVLRTRYTETQTRKSRLQRWLNVEHVFDLAQDHALEHKHVLLVDDVITTGATMEACGEVLTRIPGIQLSLASVAWASRY